MIERNKKIGGKKKREMVERDEGEKKEREGEKK